MRRATGHPRAMGAVAALLGVLGVPLLLGAAGPADPRRAGVDELSPALQAMQRDDTQNPALLWVREGEALWAQVPPGTAGAAGGAGATRPARSCADCHGATPLPVAASYPRYDAHTDRPLSLAGRIDRCRQQQQGLAPQGPDGPEVLALTAALHWATRGRPITPDADARMAPWRQRGQALWQQRFGQLNLACVHCHDQRAGERLGGARIPQAHPTGVPAYRLEWQALGSLERRLRSCLAGVRAEPFAPGADEWRALEAFLVQRAAGLPLEGASVRP